MAEDETTTAAEPVSAETNGAGDDEFILEELRQRRGNLEPFGKTVTLEVPGYDGLMGVEYKYIGAEETERISKEVAKITRGITGQGFTLLSSMETLISACKQVVIRSRVERDSATKKSPNWRPLGKGMVTLGKAMTGEYDGQLPQLLKFTASTPQEIVLGLFGSDHAILQQNIQLSTWLADVTKDIDDNFFGL